MKSILWITALFFLGGCSYKTATIKTYTLNPPVQYGKLKHSKYRDKTVKVSYPTSIKGRAGSSIHFTYNTLEEGSYQNAVWSTTDSQLLTYAIVHALEKGKVFKTVVDYTSLANSDYILESRIYDFYHKVRKDLSVAVLTMRFDLIDTDSNRIVKSRKFSYAVPTESVDSKGFVEAMDKAVARLSRDLVLWLAK